MQDAIFLYHFDLNKYGLKSMPISLHYLTVDRNKYNFKMTAQIKVRKTVSFISNFTVTICIWFGFAYYYPAYTSE
jgi:hypothetical protein